MEVAELIQLIRTCNLAQVVNQLEELKNVRGKRRGATEQHQFDQQYNAIVKFYQDTAKQPRK